MKKLNLIICLSLNLILLSVITAQEVNIESQLKAIQTGNSESAVADLEKLKQQNPNDPSVIYLDALLTRDGKKALEKYKIISEDYPKSRFADAAVYQIYSYYFATGSYTSANKYLDKLKTVYPNSTYFKLVDNKNIEDGTLATQNGLYKDKAEGEKQATEKKESFKYTIQSGAFLVQANAEKLKKTFLRSGFDSEIKEKKIGGSTFFIVNVGKFRTEDEAKSFLNDLNKNKNMDGRVVEIK